MDGSKAHLVMGIRNTSETSILYTPPPKIISQGGEPNW